MEGNLLIYGAYGYTGSLIAQRLAAMDEAAILGGRRSEPLEEVATAFGFDCRVFGLEHPEIVEARLADVDAVLNCAGPFSRTAEPLLDACLAAGTDYLDIAGNIQVLENIAQRGADADRQDITVLPSVGFDAVPTDCLAAHLAAQVQLPVSLTLALDGLETFSPGTMKSIIESLDRPGAIRENGAIRSVPLAWRTRDFDFGVGEKPAVTVPWGTISTAYHSTGIENIETFAAVPSAVVGAMRLARPLMPMFSSDPVKRLLVAATDRFVTGPTPNERAQSTSRVWGCVTAESGDQAISRLITPDTYEMTAATATESASRVLAGEVESGFQTPARAFGAGYVTEFDGVTLEPVTAGKSAR